MGSRCFHKAFLRGDDDDMGDDDWCDDETEPVTSTVPMHWIRFVKTPMHYPSYPDTSGGLPMFQRESDDNIIFCSNELEIADVYSFKCIYLKDGITLFP